jgi:hypothetical protein
MFYSFLLHRAVMDFVLPIGQFDEEAREPQDTSVQPQPAEGSREKPKSKKEKKDKKDKKKSLLSFDDLRGTTHVKDALVTSDTAKALAEEERISALISRGQTVVSRDESAREKTLLKELSDKFRAEQEVVDRAAVARAEQARQKKLKQGAFISSRHGVSSIFISYILPPI